MLRVFVCLFVFAILSIAVRFGDCENTIPDCQDVNITPGSDKTHLSNTETVLSGLKSFDALGNMGKRKNETQTYGNVLEKLGAHVTFPGTLWCGDGGFVRNENELGLFKETDACCRAHDYCKNSISAGETKLNLNNNGIFTRFACICDEEFYNCLKRVNSLIARRIGDTYFNIFHPQCFQCVCPTEDCNREVDVECMDHCMKYKWVDNPKY